MVSLLSLHVRHMYMSHAVRMLEDQQDMRGTILMRHSSQHSLTSSSSRLSSNVPEDSSDGGHLSSTLTSPNPSTDGGNYEGVL